jgi:hypothetical protein
MRFIISLSIVLTAFDATKIWRIKRALDKDGLQSKQKLPAIVIQALVVITKFLIDDNVVLS